MCLAHDRCPIMTANKTGSFRSSARTAANPEPGDRASAADIRTLFKEISTVVQSLCPNNMTSKQITDFSAKAHNLKSKLLHLDYAKSLCHMVDLFATSLNPDKLLLALGPERFNMFTSCCADVLHGCGSTVSVLSFKFLKPFVVDKCMKVCNYFMPDTEEATDITLSEARHLLKDFCSSLLPTPDRYPAATCIVLLVSYLDLDSDPHEIQHEINFAVASTLIFLCSRVSYVMEIYHLKHSSDDSCFIGPLEKDVKPCRNCCAEYNPPATGGFFHFTCHGNQIRPCDFGDSASSNSTVASSSLLDHDCKDKPSFLENEKSARRKKIRSLLTVLCMQCNMFLGACEIGTLGGANRFGESWRDVHNAMHMYKPSAAASVTYDNACA